MSENLINTFFLQQLQISEKKKKLSSMCQLMATKKLVKIGRVPNSHTNYGGQLCNSVISRPGRSQGLLYKQPCDGLIHSFINSVSEPFPPTALRRRHAQTVTDSTSSYKIDYFIAIKNFLNLEGHQNPISGSKVTAILLKGWILPIGGASAGEGLPCSLRCRLVFSCLEQL